jgi:hypothetical protein
METECLLSCSQDPVTGPCPETDVAIHTFPSYVPVIQFNIILPSMCRSSKLFLPLMFSDQYFVCIFHPSCSCYMNRPSNSPWFLWFYMSMKLGPLL